MIRIQNIYHMLSYAYQILQEEGYSKCATEEFDNTADLLSAILVKGISTQVKRGLSREYKEVVEPLSSLKGKIDINDSIKQQTMVKQQLVCSYDEFSVNTYHNQILKTTCNILMRADISKKRKKDIRNLMVYFANVDIIDRYRIRWKDIQYNRNNQSYRMLMGICYLVIKGLLQTTSDGSVKMMQFFDEQRMCRLYEKFILEYYRKEYPQLKVSSSQIPWAVDDDFCFMLPTMQSDIMLEYEGKTLIIDAKYYSRTTQVQYDVHTIHSNNLYQIFTYVKNKAAAGGEVEGMLLYAKTDEEIQPDNSYMMSGNKISVKPLDLNCDFENIRSQLNQIADDSFGFKEYYDDWEGLPLDKMFKYTPSQCADCVHNKGFDECRVFEKKPYKYASVLEGEMCPEKI